MIIRCPACNAEIEVSADQRVLKCPYCETPIIIEKTGTLTLERIKPDLAREAALIIYREYNPAGEMEDLKLVYIPFYRLETDSKVYFIPGEQNLPPAFKFFKPQGDRLSLKEEFPQPEISFQRAMEKAGVEYVNNAAIIYTPFFIDSNRNVFIDAVTGKVLYFPELKEKKTRDYFLPGIFVISGLLAIFLPGVWLKFLIPVCVSAIPLFRRNYG